MTDPFADSAGRPWAGRQFEPVAYADDDGTAPPALASALDAFRAGAAPAEAVVEALRGSRLLVPLIARLGGAGVGAHGQTVDKSADLAVVIVRAADDRAVLPAFTSVAAMQRWNPVARPVPTPAERVALAAAAEADGLLVLDPGSPSEFVLRRSALEAVARSQPWTPPHRDPAIRTAVGSGVADEEAVRGIELADGDPDARHQGPELMVRLALRPGLDAETLTALLARVQGRWALLEALGGVDSLAVKLVAAAD